MRRVDRKVDELVRELQKTTEQYKRVTQKRLDEVNNLIESVKETVSDIDADTVESIWVHVNGTAFRFRWVCSNIGCWFRLQDENYRVFPSSVEDMGSSTYLHGDFNCYVRFMDRETVLKVIRNWPEIVGQFQKKLEELAREIETA